MKTSLLISLILVGTSAVGTSAIASSTGIELPTLVQAHYSTSYIPDGFDDNDNAQMVAEGMFPNSCYKPAPPMVKVDDAKKTVSVTAMAYRYEGFCLQVMVPYHQTIDLGLMKVGQYNVKQNEEKFGGVKIRAATTSSPDDFLYAPVSQAYFKQLGGKNYITLNGTFTNSCLSLTDVIVNKQSNVITVQPISEIANRTSCVNGSYPFEKTVEIGAINNGRYLLHVRSLNAQAINTLIDVY